MTQVNEYLNYAQLSQAAYNGYLKPGMAGPSLIDNLQKGDDPFTPSQASDFTKRYSVVATSAQYGIGTASGFSATLFQEIGTNHYTLAIRGTERLDPRDLVADIMLGGAGITVSQQISMQNFYSALVADGKLAADTSLTVTGHSLGGFLAQLFANLHPSVDKVYTYNSPGLGGLSFDVLSALGVLPESLPSGKVINIYVKEWPSPITDWGTDYGIHVPISVDTGSLNPVHYHKIATLTEALHAYRLLDEVTGGGTLLETLTTILESDQDGRVLASLDELFGAGVVKGESVVDDALALGDYAGGHGLTSLVLEPLAGLSGAALAARASSDRASLYALVKLNPFVVRGREFSAYGELEPEEYSEAYLEDRGGFLSSYISGGVSRTRYEDRSLGVSTHGSG
ncbi:hypothetical protein G3N55_12025, partial [Dissulfurirhabdus thermomarina]|nr:hypothetical protein [Dissulfurirhabdus thermomarina]